jgi:hypothetical protein
MDEKETIREIKRLRDLTDKHRNDLLEARGFTRSEKPLRPTEAQTLWAAMPPELKKEYDLAAKDTGFPGSGIFFIGYRKKAT